MSKEFKHMFGGSLNVSQLIQGIAQSVDGMDNAKSEQQFLDLKDRARDLTATLSAKLRHEHFYHGE